MATITTNVYLEDSARSAGEAMTINSEGKLTVRTDTRFHANSPASMTGSLGSITCNEGEVIFDGQNVRWLPISDGSGTVSIGTTISQGSVEGYFLGAYSSLTSAPSTSIPAIGFIKLREVTGGAFSAGALSGTGLTANATGADLTGWIEVVSDDASNHTFPRLGKHTVRGAWFYLTNTNGSIGQVIDTPTNDGGAGTRVPGVWIESAVADVYDFYPALYGATNGWLYTSLGAAYGETDVRQKFVKDIGGGQFQIGEASDLSATYVNTPVQTGTYASIAHSCTYTWAGDIVTITYATGHLLSTGMSVHCDFTSGGGTPDGTYTITVIDAYTYTFELAGSGAGGNATIRPGMTISSTAHTLGVGDSVYCDFTSGSGVDGDYTIYAVTSANACLIATAHSSTVSGNVSIYSRYTIIYDRHGLVVGNRVYLDFTSGSGTDGLYTIVYPPSVAAQASTYTWAANVVTVTFTAHGRKVGDVVYIDFTSGAGTPDGLYTVAGITSANIYTVALTGSGTAGNATVTMSSFDIVMNNDASADSGNVTIKQTIGYVPPDGRKIRIPNVILRGCATASRASNSVNATIGSRPEWAVSAGGYLDFEYSYSTWYYNLAQAFNVRMYHSTLMDTLVLTEIASALDIDDVIIGSNSAQDLRMIQFTSCFAGGTVKNVSAHRAGAVGTTDHNIEVLYCANISFTNIQAGIVQYARSTGKAVQVSSSSGLTFQSCRIFNSDFPVVTCLNVKVYDLDVCDRYIGYTNVNTPYYAVNVATKSNGVEVDGVTFGFDGAIPNVHSNSGIFAVTNCDNVKLRNAGSLASRLSGGTFRPNYYGCGAIYTTGANNNNIKVQRCYIDLFRVALYTTINSDKNVTLESLYGGLYVEGAKAIYLQLDSSLNSIGKGLRTGANSVAANTSIYGNHFFDFFLSDITGRFLLAFNEPTAETASQFTMVSGTAKFNSAGGILMPTIGNQAIWEDSVFRKGHTGFVNTSLIMTGGTIGNYTLKYDIDIGNGYSNNWDDLTGSNLSAVTVDPAVGFKMKIEITTSSTNTTAITFLRMDTITSVSAQGNLYPLDTITLTLTGLQDGSDVVVYDHVTLSVRDSVDANSGNVWGYIYETAEAIDIGVFKAGFIPLYIRNYTLGDANASLPVAQVADRAYLL